MFRVLFGQRHVNLHAKPGLLGIFNALHRLLPALGSIAEPVMMLRIGAVETDGNSAESRSLKLCGFVRRQQRTVAPKRRAKSYRRCVGNKLGEIFADQGLPAA
ncbi:hypothetical protein D3C71_1757340 [compost metagenome]